VLQLLRDDRGQSWSRAELASELGVEAPAIEAALSRLHGEGVVWLDDDQISASPATRRLDDLELIGI
jgi:Mn-dependent DtxR family transcriptional regulator